MPPKKEMDPEELMRIKFRAKCQFRALGRLVLANRHWLIEGVDEYEGLDDVKRRVEQAVRAKHKKKQLLNINDKALLNKFAEERTLQEQQYLYRILGGLKCFKRYPNYVKKKLAAVTYFKYYGPNRVIVRQHQEAHALYFIVTGDVTVSQLFYDDLLQQYVSVDIGTMTVGNMFGEVSLLHNIPRTATVTTNGHCELLALMKEDFKNVLQASVQKQWDEVRRAMSAFTYFQGLDEVARREGCIVAKMKSFATNETLLGDGVGVANFVYFVLSGRCQMIESLQVVVTTHLGRNHYTLYDPYIPEEESEKDLDTKWFAAYQNKFRGSINEKSDMDAGSASQHLSSISKGVLKTSRSEHDSSETKADLTATLPEATSSEHKADLTVTLPETTSSQHKADVMVTLPETTSSEHKADVMVTLPETTSSEQPSETSSKLLLHPPSEQTARHSVRLSVNPTGEEIKKTEMILPNLRTYFMQVVVFNPGSTFGFGENMRDRRIVALTPVDCMLLPKIWLMQRNTANIWTRIQHYLEKKIPTKPKLFKEFVSARRWGDFREQIVSDVVARSNAVNFTSVHDVPYSIRMAEMLDI